PTLLGRTGNDSDSRGSTDVLFERLSNLGRNDVRTGAWIVRRYRDNWRIERGILAHAQRTQADQAEEHQNRREDDRQYGTFDTDFGKSHRPSLETFTDAPS